MKSLKDVLAFNLLNSNGEVEKALGSVDVRRDQVNPENVYDNLRTIQRRISDPLKNKVLQDFDNGNIVLLHNPEKLTSVPRFLPVWAAKVGSKIVVYVNLTQHGKRTKADDELDIPAKKMYALMQAGTIMRDLVMNPKQILTNSDVAKHGCLIYSRIIGQILDRKFGLGSEPIVLDQVAYALARFFLVNLLERNDDERTRNIATNVLKNGTTVAALEKVHTDIDDKAMRDFAEFIKALSENFPRLKNLTVRNTISDAVNNYDQMFLLGLETPQFFIMNIMFAVQMAGLNNEFRLEPLFGKEGASLYAAVVRAVR
jgi:hypothetical protein